MISPFYEQFSRNGSRKAVDTVYCGNTKRFLEGAADIIVCSMGFGRVLSHNRIVQSPHSENQISTYVGNAKKLEVRFREDDNYSNWITIMRCKKDFIIQGGSVQLRLYGGVWPQDRKIDPSAD